MPNDLLRDTARKAVDALLKPETRQHYTLLMRTKNAAQYQNLEAIADEIAIQQYWLLQQLRAVNDAAVLYETDTEGKLLYVNDQFCALSAYDRSEVLGRDVKLLKSGQHTPNFFADMWSVIQAGKPWQGEVVNRTKFGDFFRLSLRIIPAFAPDGSIMRYTAVGFDITSRAVEEKPIAATVLASTPTAAQPAPAETAAFAEAFHKLKLEYKGLVSALHNAAIVSEADLQGNITFVNDTFCRIAKYSREELIGQNHRILKSGHQPDDMFTDLWQTISKGEVWQGVIKNKAKDGSFYWVAATITPELNEAGKPVKYIGVRFDITTQIQQEEELTHKLAELHAQEEELRQTSEEIHAVNEELNRTQLQLQARMTALNNAAIVSETDLQGNITFANDTFCRVSKYSREELLGQNHRILKSGHQPDEIFVEMWQTIASGKVWQGVLQNKAKDGSFYWVAATITPELDTNGKPVKYIAVRFDITKQIEQEHELHRLLEESHANEEQLRQTTEEVMATNEELQQVQLRLNGQVNAVNNAALVSETDLQGNITFVNQAFCDVSGYEADELLGQNHRILKSGQQPDSLFDDLWATITKGEVWRGIIQNKRKDGTYYWVSATITPEKDIDGKPRKYISVRFDITKQVEQETQLQKLLDETRRSEEEQRIITEQLVDTVDQLTRTQNELESRIAITNKAALVSETDLKGIITFANETFAQTAKYTVEELIGQPHNIIRHPDMPADAFKEMWATIGRGEIWQGVVKNKARDGGAYWVAATIGPVLGPNGKPVKYIAVCFDITEQIEQQEQLALALQKSVQHEQDLERANEVMNHTLETLKLTQQELSTRIQIISEAALVCEYGTDNKITYANAKFAKLLGYDMQELIGADHSIIRHPDQPDEILEDKRQALASGKIWHGLLLNKTKTGDPLWVIATVAAVVDTEGNVVKYVDVRFDVTAQIMQEEELKEANELLRRSEQILEKKVEERTYELMLEKNKAEKAKQDAQKAQLEAESANKVKSVFLASMSHELRTPLNGILGYAQLLAASPELPDKFKDKVRIINTSGEHLLSLINGVLDLSKIEAGKMEVVNTDFNLRHVLQEVQDLFRLRAEQKKLAFGVQLMPGLPEYVHGDSGKLRQALINLVGNAIKFTTHGMVVVKAEAVPNGIYFAVTDTGRGIPADKVSEILKPFTQIQAHLNTEGGTGLGLSITANFVRLMGGNLEVNSVEGQGSTFSFILPLKIIEADAAAVQEAKAAQHIIGYSAQQPIRILVADDSTVSRDVAVDILANLNFVCAEAADGKTAIEEYERFQPDVVLIDLRLPILNGIEFVRIIREIKRDMRVKVIALSTMTLDQDEAVKLRVGFDDFILKPFSIQSLVEPILALMDAEPVFEKVGNEVYFAPQSNTALDYQVIKKNVSIEFIERFEMNLMIGNFDQLSKLLRTVPDTEPNLAALRNQALQYIEDFEYDRLDEILHQLKA